MMFLICCGEQGSEWGWAIGVNEPILGVQDQLVCTVYEHVTSCNWRTWLDLPRGKSCARRARLLGKLSVLSGTRPSSQNSLFA
jgi:hypothetical protein